MSKKTLRYKDLNVATNSTMGEALESKDDKLVKKLYKESQQEWKKTYGDWQPPARETLKFYG